MSDLMERLRDMAAGKHDDLDVAAEAIEEIIDLNWRVVQLEDERDKLRAWKQETIERLVVQGILTAAHETDPKKAVHDMLSWEVTVALDPLVSSEAQALIEQGREELRAQIAAHEKVCAGEWVKVTGRLPEMSIIDDAPIRDPLRRGLLPGIRRSAPTLCLDDSGKIFVDDLVAHLNETELGVWYAGNRKKYTHWLDARLPREER